MRELLLSLVIVFVLGAAALCADNESICCQESLCQSHLRAGCPQVVACYATPSETPRYGGYYVGGGAAVGGQGRCPDEGTWGWDYAGVFPKLVALNWWHGAHEQGGGGAYATDHH